MNGCPIGVCYFPTMEAAESTGMNMDAAQGIKGQKGVWFPSASEDHDAAFRYFHSLGEALGRQEELVHRVDESLYKPIWRKK